MAHGRATAAPTAAKRRNPDTHPLPAGLPPGSTPVPLRTGPTEMASAWASGSTTVSDAHNLLPRCSPPADAACGRRPTTELFDLLLVALNAALHLLSSMSPLVSPAAARQGGRHWPGCRGCDTSNFLGLELRSSATTTCTCLPPPPPALLRRSPGAGAWRNASSSVAGLRDLRGRLRCADGADRRAGLITKTNNLMCLSMFWLPGRLLDPSSPLSA